MFNVHDSFKLQLDLMVYLYARKVAELFLKWNILLMYVLPCILLFYCTFIYVISLQKPHSSWCSAWTSLSVKHEMQKMSNFISLNVGFVVSGSNQDIFFMFKEIERREKSLGWDTQRLLFIQLNNLNFERSDIYDFPVSCLWFNYRCGE